MIEDVVGEIGEGPAETAMVMKLEEMEMKMEEMEMENILSMAEVAKMNWLYGSFPYVLFL